MSPNPDQLAEVVLVEVAERVATITLNRPGARNALSAAVLAGLDAAVRSCESDDTVDVMVLTGTDPAFCAGLDLKELASGRLAELFGAEGLLAGGDGPPGPLPPRTKPLIGAVNGIAVTGGLELALACDFLVASDRARFADTHARVGILPEWGLTVLLPQAVGVRRAREMSATGNQVDAATALAWGLVNRVVPHDELLATCRQLGRDIASNDAGAVRAMFATYAAGAVSSTAEAWANEGAAARAWRRGGGGELSEVERRRAAVIERGRTQAD
jgi:enoyl-CoA hydratase